MTTLMASAVASIAAWLIDLAVGRYLPETASYGVSFVVWAVVFVSSFVGIKRLRDG